MNTDEHERLESVCRDVNTHDAGRQVPWHRGYVLGILVGTLILAELLKDAAFSADRGDWLAAWEFLYFGMIACLPFLLARVAPKAAGFDTQWLPGSRWHWAWFLGMLLLLLVSKVLVCALMAIIVGPPAPRPFTGPVTPIGIVFLGIAVVLIAPIAEEIFFRGYVLEQLRKLTHSGTAVLIQSILFGLFHLFAYGLFTSLATLNSVNAALFGLIVGAWRIKFRSLLPLLLAHVLLNATAIPWFKAQYDQAIDRSHVKCPTVSRETTYITEPLRKDGYPDYAAALNQRSSKGVTPGNNSAVLFWRAVGPDAIAKCDREKYFQMLGIPPLPENGVYFVDLDTYIARQKDHAKPGDAKPAPSTSLDTQTLLDLAVKRPWSKQEFPVLAAWLIANEKPLALLIEASKRSRCYDPLVCGEKTPLIAVSQPAISVFHQTGDIASALVARAMLRLSEDKVEEAWEDLLTCHRLARLLGQGPTVIDALIARRVDQRTYAAEQALLQHSPLATARIAEMRDDLDRLPPMPKMVDRLDVAERFMYLTFVLDYSRAGRAALVALERDAGLLEPNGPEPLGSSLKSLLRYSSSTEIDWDIVLRVGNSWFDRLADAYRKPTRPARRESLRKLDMDFRKLKTTVQDSASLDKSMLGDPHKAFSERLGQIILIMFWPEIAVESSLDDRATMTFELTKLAFALSAYHADHGSYPVKLAELAPKYVRELPIDIFNDAEPHYRQDGRGYLLYSVGSNGKDDGGKNSDNGRGPDECVEKNWDDLIIRMSSAIEQ